MSHFVDLIEMDLSLHFELSSFLFTVINCAVADLSVPMFAVKQGCTTGEVNYGTLCTLSCQEGYEATGSGEMTCSDDGNGVGTWTGDSIECTCKTLLFGVFLCYDRKIEMYSVRYQNSFSYLVY